MSAQSVEEPRLSGESDGPNYSTMPVQPEQPARASESVQMNGYPPPSSSGMPNTAATAGEVMATASTLEGNSSRTLQDPPLLSGVAGRQQTLDGVVEAKARPGGTEVHVGVSPATGQASFRVHGANEGASTLRWFFRQAKLLCCVLFCVLETATVRAHRSVRVLPLNGSSQHNWLIKCDAKDLY